VTERPRVAAAWLAVGAIVAIALLLAPFPDAGVGNLGWDSGGSIVQMRAASLGIVDLPGARPGAAVVGALVAGAGLAPIGAVPIVLSVAAAATLGLAAAAALRRTWSVPVWGIGVAVLLVATWGGTARLVAGYLANLLSLVMFLAGTALAIGPRPRWWAVGAAFAAAVLVHPGVAPAYGAILLGWLLLDLLVRPDRVTGPSRSIRTVVAFLAAAVAAAIVVGGLLGVSVDELQDLALARERFDERAAELVTWIDPALSFAMILAGGLVVLFGGDRRSRSALRLGIAWLAVSAGGLVVLAFAPGFPGHRTLLLGVPAPILGALAVVVVAGWIGARIARRVPLRAAVGASAVAAVVGIGIALVALGPFAARAERPVSTLGTGPDVAAGYLRAVPSRRPVVLVTDPPDASGLLAWKARLNATRALAPEGVLLRIALYVGDERALLAGRPTVRPGDDRFQAISARTWPSVRAVLEDDPVVVAIRPWLRVSAWARIAAASPVVGEDLAVLRGPVPTGPVEPVHPIRLPALEAAARVAVLLITVVLVGGGWSSAAVGVDGSPIDAIALAPAAGLATITLTGTIVVVAGADPGGAVGLAAAAAAGVAGWWTASRVRATDPA
jgi:hypothetical protein